MSVVQIEVEALCHGGIQSLWLPPCRGCCLLGGISKKLLRGIAVGARDRWLLLLRSSRTTNAGLLLFSSCCSGYCTWTVVGTGRSETQFAFNLHSETLKWGFVTWTNHSFLSVYNHESCQDIYKIGKEKPENLLTKLCLRHLRLVLWLPQIMLDRTILILNKICCYILFYFLPLFFPQNPEEADAWVFQPSLSVPL